jgi:FAD-dependent urate hydroxylase
MRVLVVGGGVGGLAAARALSADGHDVVVFEQAAGPRDGGAAVTLWSNGTGILGELNVSLDGVGGQIDVLEQRDYRGKVLVSIDVGRSASHYGYPHICLPRRRLLERLAAGLAPAMIRYGHSCTEIVQENAGVRVDFADGSFETGDLLIGADGRSSVVRDTLWGFDPAESSGWATWQGVTPIPLEVTSSRRGVMFVGPAGLCGLMPAGEGLLQWWFDQRWTPDTPPLGSPLAALRERFGHWATPVQEVLAAVSDDDVGFFPHFRHAVPRTWGTGPITLIGDAAHSMPPTRAQGANQTLEDAWALAAALRHGDDDVTEALRNYEHARSPKAALVAKQSGKEDTNEYRPWMVKLMPNALLSRYYTRWLGRISNYLP